MLKSVPNLNLVIPGHTILDIIGHGGMSTVYLARQESLQRKVAVKVIRTGVLSDELMINRFVNEAKTIARLDHPNIISIYEVNQLESGIAYYTMPYLPHGDLSQLTSFGGQQLIKLLLQICNGLSFAHNHGVVHRDLKPENLLFDRFGNVIIADFGIALQLNDKRMTKDNDVMGSSHYMSPEQVQRKNVDSRSDIYAVGSILYEKLTGESLFEEGDDLSVLMSQVNQPVPILPEGLNSWQHIIDKCLAKNPDHRYQNTEELAKALRELNNSPEKITINNTPKKWHQKKWFSFSVLFTLICAIAFSSFSLYQSKKAQQELIDKWSHTAATATQEVMQKTASPQQEPDILKPEEPIKTNTNIKPAINLVEMQTPVLTETQLKQQKILNLLIDAQKDLQRLRLTQPPNDNASSKFTQVLKIAPKNQQAIDGMNQIASSYIQLIQEARDKNNQKNLIEFSQILHRFIESNQPIINSADFDQIMQEILSGVKTAVQNDVLSHKAKPETYELIAFAAKLPIDSIALAGFSRQLDEIPTLGQKFSDHNAHDTIYITPEFSKLLLNFFAVTTTEITVADYQQFAEEKQIEETKCQHLSRYKVFGKNTWKKPPMQQSPTHPVVCVTAKNAQQYAEWISQKSGVKYRLPSKQEWLYLNQITEQNPGCNSGNIAGKETSQINKLETERFDCTDSATYTSSVGAQKADKLGIYDLHGNVSEWVLNCSTDLNNCKDYTAIGTSWLSGKNVIPTQTLDNIQSNQAYSNIGFRLIREFYTD